MARVETKAARLARLMSGHVDEVARQVEAAQGSAGVAVLRERLARMTAELDAQTERVVALEAVRVAGGAAAEDRTRALAGRRGWVATQAPATSGGHGRPREGVGSRRRGGPWRMTTPRAHPRAPRRSSGHGRTVGAGVGPG